MLCKSLFVRILVAFGVLHSSLGIARGEETSCSWTGPSVEWILATHPPKGVISGPLGSEVFLLLHKHGIPVSFISSPTENSSARLEVGPDTTTQDLLDEILRQAPGYRREVIQGRIVVYPRGEEYDEQIEVEALGRVTRGAAIYPLLRELRNKSKPLYMLDLPVLRGTGKSIYGDMIEAGGTRSVVEHLVSLLGKQSSLAFRVSMKENGRLSFLLDALRLLEKIELSVPHEVEAGSVFEATVTGTLFDGRNIVLKGSGCGVEFDVAGEGVLEISPSGRVTALRKGAGTILARYEGRSAQVRVQVKSP